MKRIFGYLEQRNSDSTATHVMYRFHIADPVYFNHSMCVPSRERTADLSTPLRSGRKTFPSGSIHTEISPLRSPGFPVEVRGVDQDHAVFFKENRIRGCCQQREVGNPGTLRSR
jgi:hypothetical protein